MQRTKPPFRADHVGSLLRPAALKEARERRAKGEITADELKAVEDREIKDVIKKQEAAGLQSITDGEFRRSWWHLDFLWGLDGVEKTVMETGIAFAATRTRNEGTKVTGKIGFSGHPMIEHFKFVEAHTKRTPKITIPAPSALYGRPVGTPIDKTVYPKLDTMFDDLGQAYKKAVRAFADAGCRYLQLDEVFIAMLCDPKYRQQMKDRGDDPEALGPLYGELINIAMSDIPSDMTVTMHLCRGNYKSTFMGTGGYEAEQEVLFDKIKVHGYFMEYDTDRAGGFEPLKRLKKDRFAVLGLVTTKTGTLGIQGRHQAAHRGSRQVHRYRAALPVAAMRLRLDRGREYSRRGRTVGEAAHDRRSRSRSVGLEWGSMADIVAGKVAIVTGAARGIGRGIALLMAQEGAKVVVCDIGASLDGAGTDAGPAQEVVDEIKKAGGQAIASTLSISEPGNGDKIVKAALDAFGRVDILVNNAGILRDRIFHRMSWSDWSDVIGVHLHGSFNMSRACATHFREQNSGALRAHDLDLGPGRQFRPGQLHGGKTRHRRAVARHRARHGAVQCALELRRAVCLDADDRFDPDRDRRGKDPRRPAARHDAGKSRAAGGLSRLRQGRRHQRPNSLGAQ